MTTMNMVQHYNRACNTPSEKPYHIDIHIYCVMVCIRSALNPKNAYFMLNNLVQVTIDCPYPVVQ